MLEKPKWNIQVGETKEFMGADPQTGKPVYFDSEATVTLDPETQNYILRWRNFEGKWKEVVWEPRTKVDVTVAAAVSLVVQDGPLEYRYTVSNGRASKQWIGGFYVEFLSLPVEAGAPEGEWHSKQLPERVWKRLYWGWSDVSDPLPRGIAPGKSESGFCLRGVQLPAIVACYAHGDAAPIRTDEEWPSQISKALPRKLLQDCVSGVTVGPGVTPSGDEPTPEHLLKSMAGFIRTSLEQGWIRDQQTAYVFSEPVRNARNAVNRKDWSDCAECLRKILEETDQRAAGDNPAITSEAHALLNLNAAWLLKRLEKGSLPATPGASGSSTPAQE